MVTQKKTPTFAVQLKNTETNHLQINYFILYMAHHKSALKAIRQTEKRRLLNRYQKATARNVIKRIRKSHNKTEAAELLPMAASLIDKLVKRNIIHRNKAANLKSKLAHHVAKMH